MSAVAVVARAGLPAVASFRRRLTGERLALIAAASAVAMLPLLRPSGPGNSSPVDVLIALAIGFMVFWAASAGLKLRMPYALAIGILIGAGALAALVGPFPISTTTTGRPGARVRRALGLLALAQDFVILAWCTALVNVMRTPGALRIVVRAWAWAAVAWAALLVGAYEAHFNALAGIAPGFERASLTFGDPNMAASYYLLGIMIVWASRTPRHPLVRAAAYLILLWALVLTGSNGGMAALLVAVVATSIILLFRRLPTIPAIAVLSLAGLLAAGLVSQVHLRDLQGWAERSGQPLLLESIGRSGKSADERRILLEEGASLYFDGGLLGWGPNAALPALADRQARFVREMHDDYAAVLVERGILGMLGFLLLIASVAVRARTVVGRLLAPPFAAAVPQTAPLAGAALGMAVAGTFYQVLHFRHLWVLLALIAALYLWGRK